MSKAKKFKTAESVCDALEALYAQQIALLQEKFTAFSEGKLPSKSRVHATYPYVRIETQLAHREDTRHSYGFAPRPGAYSTTITRPKEFRAYLMEQFDLILSNHDIKIEVGLSNTPIPIHFALGEGYHLESNLDPVKLKQVSDIFDVPDLDHMDDEIANGTFVVENGDDRPLSLFTGARIDVSLQRLKHYCGTDPADFQNYVIFTNYAFYVEEFIAYSRANVDKDDNAYTEFAQPVEGLTPQMPAYHLKMPNREGITMVNIGVGPSNAKNISDHIAVLRPHAWLMLGHCAGLRNSQNLGDYVLAHGYLREDKILDDDIPLDIPLPALAEVQKSLQQAVADVTGYGEYELKKIMRTGTVASTVDRNWELQTYGRQNQRLSQSRAIAMDMESATLAANGFRFRVPYGTLLCVSDKPLHGQLKLPGMANEFYSTQVKNHFNIGLRTMELLRAYESEKLHSRKLRSFNEVTFR